MTDLYSPSSPLSNTDSITTTHDTDIQPHSPKPKQQSRKRRLNISKLTTPTATQDGVESDQHDQHSDNQQQRKRKPGRPPKSKDEIEPVVEDDRAAGKTKRWKPVTYHNPPVELEEAAETEIDLVGEQKISLDGVLLGDRKFKVNTFILPMRHPTRRYVFAPDVAKVVGARDGFLLFQKYPQLTRLITNEDQRTYLCGNGYLASHLKGRNITILTARTMFRHFGHLVVRRGKPIRDDYFVGDQVYMPTGQSDMDENASDVFEFGMVGGMPGSSNASNMSTPGNKPVDLGDLGLSRLAARFSLNTSATGRAEFTHLLANACSLANTYVEQVNLPKLASGEKCEGQYMYLAAVSASRYSAELRVARQAALTCTAPKLVAQSIRPGASAPLYPGVLDPYSGLFLVPRDKTPAGSVSVRVLKGSGQSLPGYVAGTPSPHQLEPRVVFPNLEDSGKYTSRIDLGLHPSYKPDDYPLALTPGQVQATLSVFQHRHTDPRHMPAHTVSTGSSYANHVRSMIPPLFPITSVMHGVLGTESDLNLIPKEILASLVRTTTDQQIRVPTVVHSDHSDPRLRDDHHHQVAVKNNARLLLQKKNARGRPRASSPSVSDRSIQSVRQQSRLRLVSDSDESFSESESNTSSPGRGYLQRVR